MTAGGPRNAKGIDPKARQVAEDLARQSGLSLSDWLTEFLAEEGPEDAVSQDFFNTPAQTAYLETPRTMATGPTRYEAPEHPADDTERWTDALNRLSARIEAAEQRSAQAISGVDQSVRSVIQRLEASEREQVAVAARFEGAVQDVQHEQARMVERVRKIEGEAQGPRSAEALRSLEAALGKVAGHLYEGEGRTHAAIADVRSRMDHFEAERTDPTELVDTVVSRLAARLEEAESRTSGALRDLQASFATLDSRLHSVEGAGSAAQGVEQRMEQLAATLSTRVEESRIELAERMTASADTRFDRMERALAEMSDHVRAAEDRSAQAIERMGRDVVEIAETLGRRVQGVEHRNADAIEQVGGEVARIAQAVETKLGRADSAQAQALEKLGAEVARITERLAERISNSERRNAQAIDEVGEQMARITERISQRHERTSSDLADRIHQSEERTARLLEEAREKLEKLSQARRVSDAPPPVYDPAESLFADDPFPGFQPAATAITAPVAAVASPAPAFPPQPFRQTLTAAFAGPVVYAAAEPPTALHPREPEAPAFTQDDFDAAASFDGNLALDTREEALFEPAAEAAAEPEIELQAAEAEPAEDAEATPETPSWLTVEAASPIAFHEDEAAPRIDPIADGPAAASNVEARYDAPLEEKASDIFDDTDLGFELPTAKTDDDFEDRFEDAFAVADQPLTATLDPEPSIESVLAASTTEPDSEFGPFEPAPQAAEPAMDRPLTTRDVVERARAAARGAAPDPRRKSPAAPPPSTGMFASPFAKPEKRSSISPGVIGLAAASAAAIVGFTMIPMGLKVQLPDGVQDALNDVTGKLGGGKSNRAAPPAPADAPTDQPQMAVALAIKPLDGPAASTTPTTAAADAAAQAKPATDFAAAYAAAVTRAETKDPKGLEEIRRIANLGYAPAQFYLAKQYEAGSGGVKKDLAEARRWTERAAEGGYAKAMHNLGLYYFEGTGGPRNTTTAAQWFRRAADLGLVDSQFNLGRLYENGTGVSLNPAEAYKWFSVAARSGDGDSQVSANRVRGLLTAEARAAAEKSAAAFHPGVATTAVAAPVQAAAQNDLVTAQKALSTLGYYQGPADGAASPALRLAIAAYQRDQGLPPTGATDPVTVGKLATISR